MSLNWELSGIKDWKEVCQVNGKMSDRTYGLIMCSMPCGYCRITEANYVDVFHRLTIYEKTRGHFVVYESGPVPVTLEDVKKHIGLTTNAAVITQAQFNKDTMACLWRDVKEMT